MAQKYHTLTSQIHFFQYTPKYPVFPRGIVKKCIWWYAKRRLLTPGDNPGGYTALSAHYAAVLPASPVIRWQISYSTGRGRTDINVVLPLHHCTTSHFIQRPFLYPRPGTYGLTTLPRSLYSSTQPTPYCSGNHKFLSLPLPKCPIGYIFHRQPRND